MGFPQSFRFRVLGISRELSYLDDESAQRAAFLAVRRQVRRSWLGFAPYVLFPVIYPLIGWFFVRPLGLKLGVPGGVAGVLPRWLFEALVMTAVGLAIGYGWLWLERRRYRRALWAHLCTLGVPTCQHCGYNLTGLAQPRCPECGRG